MTTWSFSPERALFCAKDGQWTPVHAKDDAGFIDVASLCDIAKRDPATRPEQNVPWVMYAGRKYEVDDALADSLRTAGLGDSLRELSVPEPTTKTRPVPSRNASLAEHRDLIAVVDALSERVAALEAERALAGSVK